MQKVIVWDWDNTLMDTSEIIYQAQRDLFLVYQKTDLPREDAFHLMDKSSRDWMPEVFGERWKDAYRFYLERYAAHASQIKPKHFALEILEKAKKAGFFSVVLSKKQRQIILREAQFFKLEPYLDKIVGSGDAKEDKPSPVAIQTALDGVNAEQVIVIGDAKVDMQMARFVDAIAILMRKKDPKEGEFDNKDYDYFCHDLQEVWDVLRQIKKQL